jgi:hypothetical protein
MRQGLNFTIGASCAPTEGFGQGVQTLSARVFRLR